MNIDEGLTVTQDECTSRILTDGVMTMLISLHVTVYLKFANSINNNCPHHEKVTVR